VEPTVVNKSATQLENFCSLMQDHMYRWSCIIEKISFKYKYMHGIHKDNEKIIKRLNRIKGQLEGITKMITEDKYCIDIITQTSAVKSAISALEDEMLESHLSHCLHKETNKERLTEMQAEIIKVYKLKRK
jgi:DNA-binding FrmR family transcriptional regulator